MKWVMHHPFNCTPPPRGRTTQFKLYLLSSNYTVTAHWMSCFLWVASAAAHVSSSLHQLSQQQTHRMYSKYMQGIHIKNRNIKALIKHYLFYMFPFSTFSTINYTMYFFATLKVPDSLTVCQLIHFVSLFFYECSRCEVYTLNLPWSLYFKECR